MNRRGVTLIELLVAVVVLGILANIGLPAIQEAKRRADAAHVIGDFLAVRVAAFDRFADVGTYPPSTGWGVVPPGLAGSLPAAFQFQYKTVTYRWRRFSLPNGLARRRPRRMELLALDVRTPDQRLLRAIQSAFKGDVVPGGGGQVTLVILQIGG